MFNIRKLIKARKDNTPVVPTPAYVVHTATVATTVRVALPDSAWFDRR